MKLKWGGGGGQIRTEEKAEAWGGFVRHTLRRRKNYCKVYEQWISKAVLCYDKVAMTNWVIYKKHRFISYRF